MGCHSVLSQNTNTHSKHVEIGEPVLTRFERARIIGARALQISQGAPILIYIDQDDFRPIDVAKKELQARVLPIGLARKLPNNPVPNIIPIQWLEDREFISQIKEDVSAIREAQKSAPSKSSESSNLTLIPGVGEQLEHDLLDEGFRSIDDIANASVSSLSKVSGVGKKTAESLLEEAKKLVKSSDNDISPFNLTDITGVGDSTAEDLSNAGFTSVESIANAKLSDIMKVAGIGKKTGKTLIDNAKKLV